MWRHNEPGLGDLPGHVELFGLQALKEKSLKLYRDVLTNFQFEVKNRGFPQRTASEIERDIFLSEYIVEHHDMGKKPQEFSVLLAALHKIMPHQAFKIARATMQAWRSRLPVKQAPSCPSDLANALVVLAWSSGKREVAITIALASHGLLRISEPHCMRRRDVVVLPSGLCVLLAETKRGYEQKVLIHEGWIRSMVLAFLEDRDRAHRRRRHDDDDDDKWLPLSYSKFMYWLQKLLCALNVRSTPLTSHSFRRGGASPLLTMGWRVEDVCVRGQWAAVTSAKDYLRQGETLMMRFQTENANVWDRIVRLANLRLALSEVSEMKVNTV